MKKRVQKCLAAVLTLALALSLITPVSAATWLPEETQEAVERLVQTVSAVGTMPKNYAQADHDHDFTNGVCAVCGQAGQLRLVTSAQRMKQGELFTVEVFLENTRYVDLVSVALSYDEDAFQMVGGVCHVENAAFSAVLSEQKAGTVMLSPRAQVSGKVFTFRFYVKNGAAEQDYVFTGVCGVVRDSDRHELTAQSAQVQIGCSHQWGSWSGSSTYTRSCSVCKATQTGYADASGVLYDQNKTRVLGTVKPLSGGYTVANTAVYIEESAFRDCTGLTAVILPTGLIGIGTDAFAGCTKLETVFYKGSKAQKDGISMGNDARELTDALWHCQAQSAQFGGKSCWYCADCDNYFLSNGNYATATVVFQYEDGTVIRSTTCRYGEMVNAPTTAPAPAGKDGYRLTGWDKELEVCTGDAVYTAEFSAKGGTGDINLDGNVDANDAIDLLLYLSLPTQYPLKTSGDINGDGVANTDDAVMLLLHIGLPSKFFLPQGEVPVLYYNPSRSYNSSTNETNRTPDGSGYYVFSLIVDGQTKQFKTASKKLASEVDAFNYIPFGLELSGDNIIEKVLPALEIPGVTSLAVSNYDVTELSDDTVTFTRVQPNYDNVGDVQTFSLSDDLKVWNVSSYAETDGVRTQLKLGDRGIFYTNQSGEVEWGFIWYKNTHEAGHISYCEHCKKEVYWAPYKADTYSDQKENGLHLYVTHDGKMSSVTHGSASARTDVVLDLNGKTLQASSGSNFQVYGTLSIVDTVGGGKLVGSTSSTGRAITVNNGGVVNLYSGTLTQCSGSPTTRDGGVVYVDDGGTFRMYGGAICDGVAANGGNLFVMGDFYMYGGRIYGGAVAASAQNTAAGRGGNITVEDGGEMYLNGGEVYGGVATSYVESSTAKGGNGGNIYIDSTSAGQIGTANGSTVCVAGGAARNGGNLYVTGTLTVERSGLVAAGVAKAAFSGDKDYNGGNISILKSATIKGEVSDGVAYAGGNLASAGNTTTVIDGGKVLRGTAQKSTGGNINTNNGVVRIKNNALVAEGSAATKGGNISINVGGELYIDGGTIRAGVADVCGGNVNLVGRELTDGYEYATMEADNATIADGVANGSTAYSGGGNIYANYAALTTTDTRISGGEAGQCGGNILISRGDMDLGAGTVSEGGKLTDEAAAEGGSMLGSNVCRFNEGTLRILTGATVTGGEGGSSTFFASNSTSGKTGQLYVAGTVYGLMHLASGLEKITVTGNVRINELKLNSSAKLTVENLGTGASIHIDATGVFTNAISGNKAAEYALYFHDAQGLQNIYASGNALAMTNKVRCAHCGKMVQWETFDPSVTFYTGDKHLILESNVSLPKQFAVGSESTPGYNLTIDLNGKTITTTDRLALVYGQLTIMDSSSGGTGKVVTNSSAGLNGGLILAPAGSLLNIYGGTYTVKSGVTTAGRGGLIYSQSVVNIYGGTFTGGNISATGSTDALGGNICVMGDGTLNMYNATVSGGTGKVSSSSYAMRGGNIYAEGTVYIENCNISGGTAGYGGNIFVIGTFDMIDTTVTGGKATIDGGNIHADGSTDFTGCTISGGDASSGNGGNILFDKTTKNSMIIGTGTTVSGGKAKIGGNVFAKYYTSLLGTLTGGTATSYAGNIYHVGSLVIGSSEGTVAAKITDGSAPYAGNVYSGWTLTLYPGATISGGKATSKYGGNLVITHSQITTILGTVSGGSASNLINGYGGNIYMSADEGILNIGKEDGSVKVTVSGGTGNRSGGNIYINKGTLNVYKGATVTGGKSTLGDKNIGKASAGVVNNYGTVG